MKLPVLFALACSLLSGTCWAQEATLDAGKTKDIGIHEAVDRMVSDNMKPPPKNISKLDKYFNRYCDYTGGLGLGFVASHNFDFMFRQRLKKTKDVELKRLFVLQHLYREFDFATTNYDNGILDLGKGVKRKMTADERTQTRKKLIETLNDLELFDPTDRQGELKEYRERFGQSPDNR